MKITLRKLVKWSIPYGLILLLQEWKVHGSIRHLFSPSVRYFPNYPPPPNTIPECMLDTYTMNGKINVLYWFFDGRKLNGSVVHNSKAVYKKRFAELKKGKFDYYGKDGMALLAAVKEYALQDKSVIIWGLAGCNCEALAVWAGADNVYVVDYNKPICDNPKIAVMNHAEITNAKIKSDFAISYSSFEHDGLGRYGDPLSPDGDLRAMKEAHTFLKKDGILFLGVPLGQDCLVWNAHRIYGKRRLPLLLKGWQLLDVFDIHTQKTPEYPFDLALGKHIQNVLVLKRIETDYPDDEYLTKDFPAATGALNAKDVLKRINGVLYEYKHSL